MGYIDQYKDQYELIISDGEKQETLWAAEPVPVREPYEYEGRQWRVIALGWFIKAA